MRAPTLAILLSLLALASSPAQESSTPPVPSPRQWAWHKREMLAFVHFGINTFTDWVGGTGAEDPNRFMPEQLDCMQWCTVFKDAGFKGVILTAKHCDGFCLWQSTTTTFGVRSTKWRDGKGDVVAELAKACRETGLGLGVYLSAVDRSKPTGGYGAAYDALYRAQLTELLTKYGPVFEVWFDGGANTAFNWESYYQTVRDLAPGACIFSERGPDVRWSASESGKVGDPNWNTVDLAFLRSGVVTRNMLTFGKKDGPDWMPAECDVSIRPGWFYHAGQTPQVKSLDALLQIYADTVGRGAVLLLNVPPNQRGQLDETDVARLYELAAAKTAMLKTNLAIGAEFRIGGKPLDEAGARALSDGDADTFVSSEANDVEVDLQAVQSVSTLVLGEHLPQGQRVSSFEIAFQNDGKWQTVATGLTVGHKRIVKVEPAKARRIRINATTLGGQPIWSEVGIYPPAGSESGKEVGI